MEWSRVFGLVSSVLLLIGPYQLFRLRREFQTLNALQSVPDEFARKWDKRLTLMGVLTILGIIFGIASVFLR
jgi:hypothetical protein